MIGTITVNGMVLSSMPMGEYDRRLTILTVENGKISAFAKGARRPNSPLIACAQPFSYGEFSMYAGRNSYTVTAAQISNYFPGLREDIAKAYYGIYFCEFADYFTREANDEREVLKLLYQSLRAMESGKFDIQLVRRIFELKLICLEGEAPQVFECSKCKSTEGLFSFDLSRDGLLCKQCAARDGRALPKTGWTAGKLFPVSPAALYAMQFIVSTPPVKLFRFMLKEEVLQELTDITEHYIHKHVTHEMKSLEVIQSLSLV